MVEVFQSLVLGGLLAGAVLAAPVMRRRMAAARAARPAADLDPFVKAAEPAAASEQPGGAEGKKG